MTKERVILKKNNNNNNEENFMMSRHKLMAGKQLVVKGRRYVQNG